ncbi:MAG TPA: hypothetical protein VFW40_04545 [Capsulimonadaceae bacterium]|nr:hypothetical protein [Capsulimonadaceae bacterium]
MKKCKRYPVPRAWYVPPMSEAPRNPAPAEARIEDHLDHVCAPLVDELPYARRVQLRAELRARLYSLMADYMASGLGVDKAVEKAIEGIESVAPAQVVSKPAGGWWSRLLFGDPTVPIPSARRATYNALGFFGVATFLVLLLRWPWGGQDINFLAAFGFPLVAGFATAMRSSEKPVLGTLYAMLLLTPVAFIIQAVVYPDAAETTGLLYIFLWLPLGCLSAWGASRLRPGILAVLRRYSHSALSS